MIPKEYKHKNNKELEQENNTKENLINKSSHHSANPKCKIQTKVMETHKCPGCKKYTICGREGTNFHEIWCEPSDKQEKLLIPKDPINETNLS